MSDNQNAAMLKARAAKKGKKTGKKSILHWMFGKKNK